MKGHGNGAEDVGQKSSKNREQEIKGPVVMWNLFWLWFPRGGKEETAVSCLPCFLFYLLLTALWQKCWGRELASSFFSSKYCL
jgi:hypothetical protein